MLDRLCDDDVRLRCKVERVGETPPENLLAHTSPVGWEHIAFSGDFLWDRAAAMAPG